MSHRKSQENKREGETEALNESEANGFPENLKSDFLLNIVLSFSANRV